MAGHAAMIGDLLGGSTPLMFLEQNSRDSGRWSGMAFRPEKEIRKRTDMSPVSGISLDANSACMSSSVRPQLGIAMSFIT